MTTRLDPSGSGSARSARTANAGRPALEALLPEARAALPDVVALRRRLHENPELGLLLPDTQKAVLDALAPLDLELHTGGSTSAIVATLRGARPGGTLLLRADMDALPMPEHTGLPFASRYEDRMHACGHDAHVAMLVGAAGLLARRRDELAGTVKLLFQPGEEGHGGARILVEDEGLLAVTPAVDAAFAIHVDSTLPPGRIALRPGPMLASADVLSIDLHGRGGHASMPHHAVDPIPVACEIVLALQSFVTRRIDAFDPVVITITRLSGGTTTNVIPAAANLLGTIRSTSERARTAAHEGIRRVAAGIGAAHEVDVKVHILPGYPVTVNDAPFIDFTRGVAAELLGERAVVDLPKPIMGAEDFSYVLQQVPGAIVFLGARPPGEHAEPLHSSSMTIDEEALATGVALHAAMALRWLAAHETAG
ncbi:amidohydrolase [Myxococcota bacterium]|nr:amidohydrolase [Myxococcota bacterium]MCZ7619973.1 M20 family metallopeptidase [Myxococcota bacterium]